MGIRDRRVDARITDLTIELYRIPTDFPESDGTYQWDATTLVLVQASAGGTTGLGYSYADAATGRLIHDSLRPVILGADAFDIPGMWQAMVGAVRNLGAAGIAAMAISAVDAALWDLKARLLDVSLADLLGTARDAAPVYGSGGFTSYTRDQLLEQMAGWVAQGIPRVKMKIGRDPEADIDRARAVREAIGPNAELFVDANGAYSRKQALLQAESFAALDVTWFEEPVPSRDLDGLRLLRDRMPPGMDVAAGEYGYQLDDFRELLAYGAVDVLQADVTRCGGITGFLAADTLCRAHHLPLSSHCAPSLHVFVGCACTTFRHIEYFHDHVRIEHMLFDGVLDPTGGALHPDRSAPGNGLTFKRRDADQWRVS